MICFSWAHVFLTNILGDSSPTTVTTVQSQSWLWIQETRETGPRFLQSQVTWKKPDGTEKNSSNNCWESGGCLFNFIPPSRNGNFIGNLFHPQIFRPNQAKEPRERVCSHRSSSSLGSPGRCEPTDNGIIAQLLFSRWYPKTKKKQGDWKWIWYPGISWYTIPKMILKPITLRLALLRICVSEASCYFLSYLNRDPAKFFPTSSPLLLMISIPDPNTFWEGTRDPPNHSPKILQKGTAGSGNDIPKLMLAKPHVYWLVVSTPLKNMSSSVGMMTFPIYGKS